MCWDSCISSCCQLNLEKFKIQSWTVPVTLICTRSCCCLILVMLFWKSHTTPDLSFSTWFLTDKGVVVTSVLPKRPGLAGSLLTLASLPQCQFESWLLCPRSSFLLTPGEGSSWCRGFLLVCSHLGTRRVLGSSWQQELMLAVCLRGCDYSPRAAKFQGLGYTKCWGPCQWAVLVWGTEESMSKIDKYHNV